MEETKIRWTDATWNPMSGCRKIIPGCKHCYAEDLAERFRGSAGYPNGFDPIFKPKKLSLPNTWRKQPRKIFVNSMSDLFLEDFTFEQIAKVFEVMLRVTCHTYQVLTKRDDRMLEFVTWFLDNWTWPESGCPGPDTIPEHIWLGVSIESDNYTYRANRLRSIPAPVRFISAEPLLGPLPSLDLSGILWLIVGGESGKNHRPMEPEWARQLLQKARQTRTAYFFKQSSGLKSETNPYLDGKRYEEMPNTPSAQVGHGTEKAG